MGAELGNYEAALQELSRAAHALPNDGDVGLYIAAVDGGGTGQMPSRPTSTRKRSIPEIP